MHRLSKACRSVVEDMERDGVLMDASMTAEEMRRVNASRPAGEPPAVSSIRHLMADGVPVRLYHPIEAPDQPPLIMYFHGGGWVLGFLDTHDVTARRLANLTGCAVLAVDYRLAPEHRFPAAYEDAWRATEWAHAHLEELGCRRGPIGLNGDSAGGNLAAAVALQARSSDVEVGSLALIYPVLDFAPHRYSSYEEYADAPLLSAELMKWFLDVYQGTASPHDWRLAPSEEPDVSSLPATLVLAAEVDPLRSEGELWAQRVAATGVPVEHHVIPGTFHSFYGLADQLGEARKAQQIVTDTMRASLVV